MSEELDRLEVLTRVRTEVEADLIVRSLQDRGIAAKAVGEFTAAFRAEVPGDVSVLVRHADLARAEAALAEIHQDRASEQGTGEDV